MTIRNQKLLKTLRSVLTSDTSIKTNHEIANKISEALKTLGCKSLLQPNNFPLLSNLNTDIIHLLVSNPLLKPTTCLDFFNFLNDENKRFLTPPTYEHDLQTYITLSLRLFKDRKFRMAKCFLNHVAIHENLNCPVSVTASLVENLCKDSDTLSEFFDMLFRVYLEQNMFEEAFQFMVVGGSKGIKPNIFTYNALINGFIKMGKFEEVNEILELIDNEGLSKNVTTYTLLINKFITEGNVEEAEKVFAEMLERKIEPDIRVYTSMISGNCKTGNMKRAFALFDELSEKRINPNVHTYAALVNGLCRVGQMDAVKILLKEMQCKGIDLNQVVFNTIMDGYCKKGAVDEASKLFDVMEKKGIKADVFSYNIIACGLCKLNRISEAKAILLSMVGKDIVPNSMRVLRDMEKKGVQPNVVTYNALIDGYCKKGKMKEACEIKDVMEKKRIVPDVYTYTSDEAFRLYDEMKIVGLVPDDALYTTLVGSLHNEVPRNS
ncbi:hypothetical protein MKW92_046066 [Papaver armeniacum]|nr:hypothetical protein MKW92_046066 [Papaver armeniacum]